MVIAKDVIEEIICKLHDGETDLKVEHVGFFGGKRNLNDGRIYIVHQLYSNPGSSRMVSADSHARRDYEDKLAAKDHELFVTSWWHTHAGGVGPFPSTREQDMKSQIKFEDKINDTGGLVFDTYHRRFAGFTVERKKSKERKFVFVPIVIKDREEIEEILKQAQAEET